MRDPARLAAAIDLGVAMQLSNIARDVGEDARNGRVYLPLDWLSEAGIDPDTLIADPMHSAPLGRIVDRLLDAADTHYRQATAGITRLLRPNAVWALAPLGCFTPRSGRRSGVAAWTRYPQEPLCRAGGSYVYSQQGYPA